MSKIPVTTHKCRTCAKTFKRKWNLKAHEESHNTSRPRPFICGICGKAFYHKKNLLAHSNAVHLKTKTQTCIFCEKQFYRLHELYVHILHHIEEKPIFCDKCEKEFTNNSGLLNHQKQHKKYKPYKCDQCPTFFKWECNLWIHYKRHGAKSLECVMCLKMFAISQELLQHVRSHLNEKPYMCSFCDQEYKHYGGLMRHLKNVHDQNQITGSQNLGIRYSHFCVFCMKTFPTSHKLFEHIRSHLNEKSFSCPKCDKELKSRLGLKWHLEKIKCKKVKGTTFKTSVLKANTTQLEISTTPIRGIVNEENFMNENSQSQSDIGGNTQSRDEQEPTASKNAAEESAQQGDPERQNTEEIMLVGVVKYCGVCREKFCGEKADKKYAMHIVANKHYIMYD